MIFTTLLTMQIRWKEDNTLATFAQHVGTLISVLESESNIAIDWFETKKMIVNPDKFSSIITDKKKQDHTKETFGNKVIEASLSVNLLVLQIDDKLNFNLNITKICSGKSVKCFNKAQTILTFWS